MKIIFTLLLLAAFSFTNRPALNTILPDRHQLVHSEPADNGKEITIGSNRQSGELLLRFSADKEGMAAITLQNGSGEIVLQQTSNLIPDTNIIPLKNTNALPEGSYTVRLISNNETYTAKFMVLK